MYRKIDLLSQDLLQKEISSQNDINKTLMQIQAISFDNRIGYIQPH